jgi:steroid delta-isomerase
MTAQVPAVNSRSHIEEALRRYISSWATNDIEGRVALFAEDVIIEDPAGSRPLVGRVALREFLTAGMPARWRLAFAFVRTAVVGDEAILTYRIRLDDGRNAPAELLVNGHAVFGADGLIHRYRTFFDEDSISDVTDPSTVDTQ